MQVCYSSTGICTDTSVGVCKKGKIEECVVWLFVRPSLCIICNRKFTTNYIGAARTDESVLVCGNQHRTCKNGSWRDGGTWSPGCASALVVRKVERETKMLYEIGSCQFSVIWMYAFFMEYS